MGSYTTGGKPHREMQVLALGLPRTGSMSMARALTILGYRDVYHTINALDNPHDWEVFDRASDAFFPSLPTHDPTISFTRADWDQLWGPCEATTEVASLFAPHLIEAYPAAKVVLVTREYDPWLRSVEEGIFGAFWSWPAEISIEWLEPLLGSAAGRTSRKLVLGFFEARDVDEARKNARRVWERHRRRIREMVPPERLLEYKLGDGWRPLCAFLGRPVPEGVDFPRVNDAQMLRRVMMGKIQRNMVAVLRLTAPWVALVLAIGLGLWLFTPP
ncbi:hypothetical protein NLU13_1211 [Sarocladium strictum]|uniref:P-loop containing nucleoside triphosphate hydrolase protein n=1 Tax=Sarocladium strictum TaxID=5046 RepID=A0AA39LC16_SARSR|nr:hypothetical protein NLU13_1211 [Sarocladium strictum]